jgi:uncharacterized protein YjbI with pentapeptide repeats
VLWATFWALFSQTHLVTLLRTAAQFGYCVLLPSSKLQAVNTLTSNCRHKNVAITYLLTFPNLTYINLTYRNLTYRNLTYRNLTYRNLTYHNLN